MEAFKNIFKIGNGVSPAEKKYSLSTRINIIMSLVAVAFPLIPTAMLNMAGERTSFFSMIKAVNHDIGSVGFRDGAFRLLMFYFIGALFIAVGCVSVYYKLRSAAVYTLGGSFMLFLFSVIWFSVNHDTDPNLPNVAVSRISEVYDDTAAPIIMVILAVLAIATSVWMLMAGMGMSKKPVKNSR